MLMEFASLQVKLSLCGDEVVIEAAWNEHLVSVYGRPGRIKGALPDTPCTIAVTTKVVTIEGARGGKLEIQLLARPEISIGEDE